MMGTLYVITNRVNGMQYIGKTYKSADERFQEHVRDSRKKHNKKRKLYQAMNEFGVDNFYVMEIGQYEESELERKEMEYIHYYDTYRNGYNQTLGGDGKRYIDMPDEDFVKLYRELGTVKAVANVTGHDEHWISKIIKASGENVCKGGRKPIIVNEVQKEFDSVYDCACWLIEDNKVKTGTISYVSSSIRRVLRGERKKYCGFTFTLI